MFHDKIKQRINLDYIENGYIVHFGVQDSLLRAVFGRGAKSHFKAKSDLELREKLSHIIDTLENGSAKSAFGFYLAFRSYLNSVKV